MMTFLESTGMQVISGGQTGVDLAALRVAQCLGIRTGGTAPRGYKTLRGMQPTLGAHWKLKEGATGYSRRTHQNAADSTATLIIASNVDSAGTKLTLKYLDALDKPYHIIKLEAPLAPPTAEQLIAAQAWLKQQSCDGFILNVAGNSSDSAPGIFLTAYQVLLKLFTDLLADKAYAEATLPGQYLAQLADPQLARQLHDSYDYHPQLDPRTGAFRLIIEGGVNTA